ncbi:MAG: signal peptidase I [Clostridia bacterium]|nr:signal peptidase I [Clostridia bacterium]
MSDEMNYNNEEPNAEKDPESDYTVYIPAYAAAEINRVRAESVPEEAAEPAEESGKKKKRGAARAIFDYLETFCFAVALMMVLFLYVFRYVSVDGSSMRETLQDSDKLIISNLFYTPKTGDIIVINPENHAPSDQPIIKRVIATGGQTVFIDYDNWEIYVDGIKLDEPYINAMREEERRHYGEDVVMAKGNVPRFQREFTVEEGRVFVLGDNRNNSHDSRYADYAEIGVNRILGRVLIRVYPGFGKVE